MPSLRTLVFGISLAALLAPAAQAQPRSVPPELVEQIRGLRAEKAARTPLERKLGSRLLFADRMRRQLPIAAGVSSLRTGVPIAGDGSTLLDLDADVTPALLDVLRALGGAVIDSRPERGALRVRLPFDALRSLAAQNSVRRVRPADPFVTRKLTTTEGDTAHRADQLRGDFGVDGGGLSIGVLSDGVDSLAALQASGDLPMGVTVLPGQAGSGSEGTAMFEILHDLAPGAQLLFATAVNGQAGFAANILALEAAGADVIVDDVGYFTEAVFQDDDVAAAVDDVAAAGALYFSAAGNSGNANDGTSGVWEGDFDLSGSLIAGDPAHAFSGVDIGNRILAVAPTYYTLHWSDPLAGSGNDYDLYLVNAPMTRVLAASNDFQDGDDDPFEIIFAAPNDAGRQLVITRFLGSERHLHLNVNGGRLEYATGGQLSGHPAAAGAFAVAAVDADTGTPFSGTESVETYSSDGPRRVFYEADGSVITPGNLLATGGELRSKPDLAAADCVSTSTPGFATFCGTSAAAPHAAAIAALLLEAEPAATPQDIRAALEMSSFDIEANGNDPDSGAGLVDASAAGYALLACQTHADCSDGALCSSGLCTYSIPAISPPSLGILVATLAGVAVASACRARRSAGACLRD